MQRIHADEIKVGMVVHDEYGPSTFMVTGVNVSEHSTSVTGLEIVPNHDTLNPTTSLFINGDSGIWNLSD